MTVPISLEGETETKTSASIIIGANPQSNSSTMEDESVEDAFQDSESSRGREHGLFISQQAGSHGHINQSVCSIRTKLSVARGHWGTRISAMLNCIFVQIVTKNDSQGKKMFCLYAL